MIALLLWIGAASAHALAPAGLDLTLVDATHTAVDWRTPLREPSGESLTPVWPPGCTLAAGDPTPDEAGALVQRGTLTCSTPLVGQEVGVDGLDGASVDVVITVRAEGGRVRRALLHSPVTRWTVAEPDSPTAASWWPTLPRWAWWALRTLAVTVWTGACVEAVHRGREGAARTPQVLGWVLGVVGLCWWWAG